MNKKIIIASIIFLLIIGFGLYIILSKDAPGSTATGFKLPFGLGGDDDTAIGPVTPPNNDTEIPQSNSEFVAENGLRRISDGPVSGFITLGTASSTVIRYMDRGTGNIFDFDTSTNTKRRVTNTTIPKALSVFWGESGNSFIAQTVKGSVISNYSATIGKVATTSSELAAVTGEYLSDSILTFAISPKRDSLFFLEKIGLSTTGNIADVRGKNPKKIWEFNTDEWTAQFPVSDTVFLTTKASKKADGYLFSLNVKTGVFTPILSHMPALTTLVANDGKKVLYATMIDNFLSLSAYTIADKGTESLPFSTLPEKCMWLTNTSIACGVPKRMSDKEVPDSWFMGITHFDDDVQIATIGSTDNAALQTISLADENGGGLDVILLQSNIARDILVFQNKKDLSLWVLPIQKNTP